MNWELVKFFWPAIASAAAGVWWWWTHRGAETITRDDARARGAEATVKTAQTVVDMLETQLRNRLADYDRDAEECRRRIDTLETTINTFRTKYETARRDIRRLILWVEDIVTRWDTIRQSPTPPPLPPIRFDEEEG